MPIAVPDDDRLHDWRAYEERLLALMAAGRIEASLSPDMLDGTCLLCSEATPHHCHRRLVCEYLNEKWPIDLAAYLDDHYAGKRLACGHILAVS